MALERAGQNVGHPVSFWDGTWLEGKPQPAPRKSLKTQQPENSALLQDSKGNLIVSLDGRKGLQYSVAFCSPAKSD